MNQRARDFWLEAKHLGDVIRNPTAAALVPPAGTEFYKSQLGNFVALACLPVPFAGSRTTPTSRPSPASDARTAKGVSRESSRPDGVHLPGRDGFSPRSERHRQALANPG